jgi:nitrilase
MVRVAVVQACPVILDRFATLEKVAKLTKEAKSSGAELVLFPEAFISCYPRGCDFGTVIGSRSEEGRDLYREYVESSVGGREEIERLGDIAKENGLTLVIGVVERDGGTLYCSVLTYDEGGALLGKHRKVMPTAQERVVWGQGDGSTLHVFQTKVGKVGSAICWENYMPLLRTALYAKGRRKDSYFTYKKH